MTSLDSCMSQKDIFIVLLNIIDVSNRSVSKGSKVICYDIHHT